MTEEDYKRQLNAQEIELCAFEDKYKEVFNEWLKLKNNISNTKLQIENKTWMVGNYYRMYGDTIGDFYIHVEKTSGGGKKLSGKVVRIIEQKYSDSYFSSAVIIEGGLNLPYSGNVELVQITENEFNKVSEGLPVYNDGRQRIKYEKK